MPTRVGNMSLTYLSGKKFTLFAEAELGTADLDIKGHPNAMPFTGTLLLVDQPSDKPPQGADGHRIFVPRAVAESLLPTLPGMGVNFAAEADRHEATKKVGVVTAGWLDGNKVKVRGVIWSKDFPDEAQTIKANAPRLGMSMELADVWVENRNSPVWKLTDFKFTGGAILLKNAAAYYKTGLAAAADRKSSFKRAYIVAFQAAAAVVEGKTKGKGDGSMPTKRSSKSHRGSSRNREQKKLVLQMAAATSAGVTANLRDPLNALMLTAHELRKSAKLLAAAAVTAGGRRMRSRGKDPSLPDPSSFASAGDPSRDPSDMSAAGNPSRDPSDMSAMADEFLHARGRGNPSADPSDMSAAGDPSRDPSDMSAAGNPSRDPSDMSAAGDPSRDPSDMSAAGNPSRDPSDMSAAGDASGDASSEPGKQNSSAMAKFRKNSKRGIKAMAASGSFVREMRAQAHHIDKLEAQNAKLARKLRKSTNLIDRMQAQIDKFSDMVDRRSVSAELAMVLSKGNYSVAELRASGEKIAVDQFDQLFAACAEQGIVLGVEERVTIKNQATELGILDDGAVVRR